MMKQSFIAAGLLVFGLVACRGEISTKPPIHPNQNMDNQARFDAQEPNPFFADGRSARPYVAGTVAFGSLDPGEAMLTGRGEQGWAHRLPDKLTLDRDFLERGQERYDIFCAPCHDVTGAGNGKVVERGMFPPPSFQDERLLAMPVGQLYDVIANGARNMPPYASQIPLLEDRWAIAAYVRTLQVSRNAKLDQIPRDQAVRNRWEVR